MRHEFSTATVRLTLRPCRLGSVTATCRRWSLETSEAISAAELERMMKLQDVILKAMAKKITWLEAAEIIGVCDRTMRRMRERYEEFGYKGLFDQRRRKRQYIRVPMQTAE
jgi:hypothetical protein